MQTRLVALHHGATRAAGATVVALPPALGEGPKNRLAARIPVLKSAGFTKPLEVDVVNFELIGPSNKDHGSRGTRSHVVSEHQCPQYGRSSPIRSVSSIIFNRN